MIQSLGGSSTTPRDAYAYAERDSLAPFENGATFTLSHMLPGENRWIGVTFSTPNGDGSKTLPVTFTEMAGNLPVNGFTVAAVPSPLGDVIRETLKSHAAVYLRLHSAFAIHQAGKEGEDAQRILRDERVYEQRYLKFLRSHQRLMNIAVSRILAKQRGHDGQDLFGTRQAVRNLEQALRAADPGATVMADATLLSKLDALQTMLQKEEGDPADILQMVRWQKQLYVSKPQLQNLPAARRVEAESERFIGDYARRVMDTDAYRGLLRNLVFSFHETAESLDRLQIKIGPELRELEEHLGRSAGSLVKAHREYLVKLQEL